MTTLAASRDCYIYQGSANSNYASGAFRVGWLNSSTREYRGLVTFPVSGLRDSATLRLYLLSAGNVGYIGTTARVHRCLRDYAENQATWNVWATESNWQTTGAAGPLDIDTSMFADSTVPSTGQWQAWDVTTIYNAAVLAGASEVSFRVSTTRAYGSNLYGSYESRESLNASLRPQLVVGNAISPTPPTGITFTSGTAPSPVSSTVTFSRALTIAEGLYAVDAANWTITDGTISTVTLNAARTIATLIHSNKDFNEQYTVALMDGATEIASIELDPLGISSVYQQSQSSLRVTTNRVLMQPFAEYTANWSVSGMTITSATRISDLVTQLNLSGNLVYNQDYTVSLAGLAEFDYTAWVFISDEGRSNTYAMHPYSNPLVVGGGYVFVAYLPLLSCRIISGSACR